MSTSKAKVTAWIPKPKFIVMVGIALAAIVLILKAGASNEYVQKVRAWLGLSVT